jgi:hypothetical protein
MGQLVMCNGHIQRTITTQNVLQQTFICGGCPNYYANTCTIDRISRLSDCRMSCSLLCDVLLVVMKLMSFINLVMTKYGCVWLLTELGKTSGRRYCVSTSRHGFITFISVYFIWISLLNDVKSIACKLWDYYRRWIEKDLVWSSRGILKPITKNFPRRINKTIKDSTSVLRSTTKNVVFTLDCDFTVGTVSDEICSYRWHV